MYGIYSINLERFLLISNDLWMLMHSANLLSSKFVLCVCMIDDDVQIYNSNCLTWTLSDPTIAILDKQTPRLKFVHKALFDTGRFPVDIPLEKIVKYQEFSNFVLNVSNAARITDALLNANNQKYFLKLLDSTDNIVSINDDTKIPDGFVLSIDKILYLADSKDEAFDKILNLINEPINTVSWLASYKKTFLKLYNHT